jgi:type VI secretion system protein ImpK
MVINAIKALTDSVVIVGHTDSTGRAESNWSISRARAESVEGWLKQGQRGILSTVTRGVADTQPITEITSDSRNRRVEILIFLQESL